MKSFYKLAILLLLTLFLCGCSTETEEVVCYVLPTDKPAIVTSPVSASISIPTSVDEWVFTNYKADLSWTTDTDKKVVRIALPAIQPVSDFAMTYNNRIEEWGNDLLADICTAANDSAYINTCTVSYEAYLNENLLSILLIEEFDTGECDYAVANFDVATGKELRTPDMCLRLLGLDYPSFLLASNLVVQNDFRNRYYNSHYGDAYEDVFDVLSGEEKINAEIYHATLHSMPTDTFNLYHRSLYMDAEGQVMLVFQGLQMSEDWWYGLDSEDRISSICLQEIGWVPSSNDSAFIELLTLAVSGRRYYPEYYSYILHDAFIYSPKEYTSALSRLDKSQKEYTINMMEYSVTLDTETEIVETCYALIDGGELTSSEQTAINMILTTFS